MSVPDLPMRVVFVGWGAIGQAAHRLLVAGDLPVQIVAVAVRDPSRPRTDLPDGARLVTDPAALAGLGADLVVEAAGRDSVAPWARAALGAGTDFVLTSTSALAAPGLLDELRGLAERSGGQLVLHPGALGGIDALAAARHMGLAEVEHRIVKPAAAWRGTPAEELCALGNLEGPTVFFTGPADEAAARFPQNANAALTTALAGAGAQRTRVTLIADPDATGNRHEITATGGFGRIDVQLENSPLPENPKSSAMTALSIVRLIESRVAPVVV